MMTRNPVTLDDLAVSKAFEEFGAILSTLVGIPVVLCAPDSMAIVNNHWYMALNPICSMLRSHPEGLACCRQSDRDRFARAVATRQTVRCPCHAGFIDIATPLFHRGTVVGMISVGQFLPAPPNEDEFQRFLPLHQRFGFSVDELKSAYYGAPYLDSTKVDTLVKFLAFFAEHMCEMGQLLLDSQHERRPGVLLHARQYIDEHLTENISLTQVATAMRCSPGYLSALFRKETGLTFTEYIQHKRMQEVKHLLTQTSLPITQIAFACGFNSLSQFNRIVKKCERMTPRELRRMHNEPTI